MHCSAFTVLGKKLRRTKFSSIESRDVHGVVLVLEIIPNRVKCKTLYAVCLLAPKKRLKRTLLLYKLFVCVNLCTVLS